MIATIRSPSPHESDRIFRCAALPSGLNIDRRSLAGRDIATAPTTAIDSEAVLVRLMAVLAHSSSDRLSSERQVGANIETAAQAA